MAGHPQAHAELSRSPEWRTGLEISRADLSEDGHCPEPGPWSPCSASAGLTEAYLDHLARTEPGADPGREAEAAYLAEQFRLLHDRGMARYASLPCPVPSAVPGHPYVGGYLCAGLGHAEPDGPAGGVLLVGAPAPTGAPFLERHRALARAEAHWWHAGFEARDLLAPGAVPAPARRAIRALLAALAQPAA